MRLKLWMRESIRSVLAQMICSPVRLRSRVVLMPIFSTVPRLIAEHDDVAHLERTVEHDGERGEEIAEHALRRESDGNAADAETRNERRHVETEILEDQQKRERPDADAHQHLDDRDRVAHGRLGPARRELPDQQRRDDAVGPERELNEQRHAKIENSTFSMAAGSLSNEAPA